MSLPSGGVPRRDEWCDSSYIGIKWCETTITPSVTFVGTGGNATLKGGDSLASPLEGSGSVGVEGCDMAMGMIL